MEVERVYLGYSMTQASHLLEPIRALMATLAIIFNLATSPKDLGFELPAGFHTDDFAASDNLSGEEVAKKTAMRTGPLKTRERWVLPRQPPAIPHVHPHACTNVSLYFHVPCMRIV